MAKAETFDPRHRYDPVDAQQNTKSNSWQIYLPSDADLANSLFGLTPEVTASVNRVTQLRETKVFRNTVQTGVDTFTWKRGGELEFYCAIYPHWNTLNVNNIQSLLGTLHCEAFTEELTEANPRLVFFSRNDGELRRGFGVTVDSFEGEEMLKYEAIDRLNSNRSNFSPRTNSHQGRYDLGMDIEIASTFYETEKAIWVLKALMQFDVESQYMDPWVDKVSKSVKNIENINPNEIMDMFRPRIDTTTYIHRTKHNDKILDF